ncbi:MAG: 2OG-Fe(II) oxygenase [Hyphomicrobiaceae bacterium]|nr:2OG-Fe(II) oxygenase [Hyphomicrobiaceae bacterium]
MRYLDIDRLRKAKVEKDPYEYTIIPNLVSKETVDRVNDSFPSIPSGGSFPIESLTTDMLIKDVIADLDSREFEEVIEEKFGVELAGRPKMYSLRGHTRAKDGQIHTDSKDKIITVLLYLNREWPEKLGRLRILRDGQNLENYVAEVAPDNGTMLIFKRSDNSWHGHPPFAGPRRSLQMNWMVDESKRGFHVIRHKVSAALKKMGA